MFIVQRDTYLRHNVPERPGARLLRNGEAYGQRRAQGGSAEHWPRH